MFAYAAAQVKKCLEVSKELGAENYGTFSRKKNRESCYANLGVVFWGGREGYFSLLNTNMKKELDHLAAFLKMAAEYKKEIGFNAQFLIEPKVFWKKKHSHDLTTITPATRAHKTSI